MSNKVRLITTISAICMVLALLTVGVWAVSTASVTLGGSVSFTADNIHARVTGSVTGTQETISLAELNYSADTAPSEDNINTWANNDMTFTSENLITMTITVENLSEERSLFVTLTDNTTTENVGKTLKQGASDYTSATAVEVTAGNTTTFTMTLSVTDKNQSASAIVSYQVDLRDANAEEEVKVTKLDENKKASGMTFDLNDTQKVAFVEVFDNTIEHVVIPESVEYNETVYTVTCLVKRAFENCTKLVSVVIPDSVQSFDDDVFNGCTNLVTVDMPSRLTYIGMGTFAGCLKLQNISIPSGLTTLDVSLFNGCTNLTKIEIPENVTNIDDSAFGGCGLNTVVINSQAVVDKLTERTSQGCLLEGYPENIYLRSDITISSDNFISSYWEESTSDKDGYTLYIKAI